jgi:hypothetical protein
LHRLERAGRSWNWANLIAIRCLSYVGITGPLANGELYLTALFRTPLRSLRSPAATIDERRK